MARIVKVTGGMLVRRRVATTDMATRHTKPQVEPNAANPKTVLAPIRARHNLFNLIQVATFVGHNNADNNS